MMTKIYPRTGDRQTVYLNAVVDDPQIEIGDYTIYNDFVSDPLQFQKNNVPMTCGVIAYRQHSAALTQRSQLAH